MKEIYCKLCKVYKCELEFTFLYFKKKYLTICKLCISKNKIKDERKL